MLSVGGFRAGLRRSLWPSDTAASGVSSWGAEHASRTVNFTHTLSSPSSTNVHWPGCCWHIANKLLDVELDVGFCDALCGFAHVLNEDNQTSGWLADCNSLNATYPSDSRARNQTNHHGDLSLH
jgi:hypothetical protein